MFNFDYCINRCSLETFNYNPGIIGKNYDKHRIMFVLHRSDDRANPENGNKLDAQLSIDLGLGEVTNNMIYSKALKESDTGRILGWLLRDSGLTYEDVYITNLFKCLLPDDRNPKYTEYVSCTNLLKNQIISAAPKKIVVFGGQSLKYMFPETDRTNLGSIVSEKKSYEGIPSLIMYHPRRIHDLKKDKQIQYLKTIREFILPDV
ncbi:MAG: uracil-DNA glycosylase family protein [Candidatus Woesearchaeota archaeon]